MELQSEYRPPTQSQNGKTLSGLIPKCSAASTLVDKATKCFDISTESPEFSRNQRLAVSALVMVSCVVNVLEAIIKRVVFASSDDKTVRISVASIFETKCVDI